MYQMGQRQSQEIDNFVRNNLNTTAITEVISNYATETNAVSTNVQAGDVLIRAPGGITGNITFRQNIVSYIDMLQLVDQADKTQLTNDLQSAVSNSLENSLRRFTDGLAVFSNPTNQAIKNRVIDEIDTYVNQVINTNTLNSVLLNASNYQQGSLVIDTSQLTGDVDFTQEIQSDIIARNLVKQVIERAITNKSVQELLNLVESRAETEEVSPITTAVKTLGSAGIGGIITIVIGVIIAIVAVIAGLLIPAPSKAKFVVPIIGIVIGVILVIVGVYLLRR